MRSPWLYSTPSKTFHLEDKVRAPCVARAALLSRAAGGPSPLAMITLDRFRARESGSAMRTVGSAILRRRYAEALRFWEIQICPALCFEKEHALAALDCVIRLRR